MIRGAWVWRNGVLVEKGGPKDLASPVARSELPCPMIVSDAMDEVEHPCDGQHYSSKSTFRRVTRANGCVEVGDDSARKRRAPKPDKDKAISDSIDRAFARVGA